MIGTVCVLALAVRGVWAHPDVTYRVLRRVKARVGRQRCAS
jgi:hypothetical protein